MAFYDCNGKKYFTYEIKIPKNSNETVFQIHAYQLTKLMQSISQIMPIFFALSIISFVAYFIIFIIKENILDVLSIDFTKSIMISQSVGIVIFVLLSFFSRFSMNGSKKISIRDSGILRIQCDLKRSLFFYGAAFLSLLNFIAGMAFLILSGSIENKEVVQILSVASIVVIFAAVVGQRIYMLLK